MHLPSKGRSHHLPKRFPIGATYVVEGHGGEDGDLRVFSRYVVLPGGRRINLQAEASRPTSSRALPRRHNYRQILLQNQSKSRSGRGGKKFIASAGTARQHGR
jgi:hypothetical protein